MENIGECLKKWGFSKDPFGESYPYPFWAMPARDIELLKFLIRGTKDQGGVLNVLVRGEYGSGKTYTLKTIQGYVESDLKGMGIYFQIQPKSQTKGFIDIHKEIIRQIGAGRIVHSSKKIIEKENIKDVNGFKAFLEDKIDNADLISAICNLTFNTEFALTWAWLKGDATIWQQRSLNLEGSPKDETIALEVITGLLDFLLMEYPLVVLCIDELENLIGTSRPILSIREGIRNFYDRLIYDERGKKVAIISSVTAELVYQTVTTMGKPLLDRLDREIELKSLEDKQVEPFVKKLFAWARNLEETSLTPPFYDEKAVNEFLTHVKTTSLVAGLGKTGLLTPRRIIKVGKYILQEACFDEQETINSKYIKRLFEQK